METGVEMKKHKAWMVYYSWYDGRFILGIYTNRKRAKGILMGLKCKSILKMLKDKVTFCSNYFDEQWHRYRTEITLNKYNSMGW